VAGIAYQLTCRKSYTLIAAFFAATDGLFIVESRYALNNIYLISLGLLGQLFFLIHINKKKPKQWHLIFSGISLGASAAIKWNGLSFLLGVYLLLGIAKLGNLWENRRSHQNRVGEARESSSPVSSTIKNREVNVFKKIASIKLSLIIINFIILPIFTYSILWIPHLIMNPKYKFWQMQKEIFLYHQRIGNAPNIHPYCSSWYSWLIMWRPVAYFYEKSTDNPPIIHDVHAMGNPILWWLSTLAVFLVIGLLARQLFAIISKITKPLSNSATWLGTYIVVNYTANLLPWITVKRCIFLYHYMGAYIFAWLALAWAVDYCLQHDYSSYKIAGLTVIFLVFAAFIYWLPLYLGLPLSQEGLNFRLLLPNWI
jgi:dolichyl-phosphate-mannose--protein O-mannosyl transferase